MNVLCYVMLYVEFIQDSVYQKSIQIGLFCDGIIQKNNNVVTVVLSQFQVDCYPLGTHELFNLLFA